MKTTKKTEEAMKLANQVLKIDKRIAEAYLIKGMIYHYLLVKRMWKYWKKENLFRHLNVR